MDKKIVSASVLDRAIGLPSMDKYGCTNHHRWTKMKTEQKQILNNNTENFLRKST